MRPEAAADVVSPAYDAMSSAQRQGFRRDHPDSYLHVTRSTEDEPDADTVDNTTLVSRGRVALDRLVRKDLFVTPGPPAFYVYRLVEGAHAQCGLVCEIPSDHLARTARPHEATRPDRTALLTEHFRVVRAASSPLACAVRDDGGLERELDAATTSEPLLDFAGGDGVKQTVWRIDDPAAAERLSARLDEEQLFIIDGHHRCAALQQIRAEGVTLPVLTAIFPEQSLRLVGFHRLLRLAGSMTASELLDRIGRRFRVESTAPLMTVAPGSIAVVVDDRWFRVHFDERPVDGDAIVRLGSLDPVVLDREILRSIVAETTGEVDITYTPDIEPFPVILATARAQGRVPIFVPPVSIEDMMAVAEGGVIMPAKSTYFTPKVRSGVFLRRFDDGPFDEAQR